MVKPTSVTTTTTGLSTTPNVVINFNSYMPSMPMPSMPMAEAPAPVMEDSGDGDTPSAIVKVFDDKTVVKILNDNSSSDPGCYFDEDGNCPMCGYATVGSEQFIMAHKHADKPYGKVEYADPGYRDGKARYPIDTEAHVRAALAYISMPKNAAKYTPEQLSDIKGRIHAAAKRHGIEVSTPAPAGETGMGLVRVDTSALLAGVGAAPVAPPASWFSDPQLQAPTKLTITSDGRVFGHLAAWRTCHVGIGNSCVVAPKSRTGYSLFRIGSILCDDGAELSIGKIVMGSAHANAQWGVMPARDFYDNTSMTAALVNVGEDQFGIWVSGALTADMTPERIAALRASALSGDWRTVNGNMELIAALAVNSPGFPIYRESAGRAFSLQSVGVIGADEEISGEFSMSDAATPPTGIDSEQAALFARINEIDDELTDHRRTQRFAQLAVLDEQRASDHRPQTYANNAAIRGQLNGGRMQILGEPDDQELDELEAALNPEKGTTITAKSTVKVTKRS